MTDFKSSKSFLFVYQSDISKDDLNLIMEFAGEIKAEKKDVFFLIYHDIKKLSDLTQVKSFDIHVCKKDFNFLQKPSSSTLTSQLQLNYDFLISCIDTPNKRIENFIKKCKALTKIGMWEPSGKSIYNVTLSATEPNKKMETFLTMAGNCLTKLKTEK